MPVKHDITPILEHYGGKVVPDRYGWHKMKCPFHEDSHASAVVNTEINAFTCFGCGIKGDTYKIIMQKEGIGFREAITFAEGLTGKSSNSLSKFDSSSRRVSSGSGIIAKRRGYSPPRASRRTLNGT